MFSAATPHPFGVPEDHVSIPTVANTSNGEGDGIEPSTLPVYTAEDEGIPIKHKQSSFSEAE